MKHGSIFWVVNYIKSQRDSETRYTIDLYLLRLGYDAGTIEDAWQIAGLRLESKKPSFFKYLFPVTALCSLLSWVCLTLSWYTSSDGAIHSVLIYTPKFYEYIYYPSFNSAFLYFMLIFWGINCFLGLFIQYSGSQIFLKLFPAALNFNFLFISAALAFDGFLILQLHNWLVWQGPVFLTLILLIALTCTLLELKYAPKKIEIILPAHPSQ